MSRKGEWDHYSQGPVRTRERVAAAIACAVLLAIFVVGLIEII
ncbi:MAG TPA: hypothetical protein VM450_13235 [Thermomicrobiales bacterium]|nr:hypothetical protein [Thermomicrobiales bacterium]